MKTKLLLGILASLALACCASWQVKKQESATYGDLPFDRVWNAAVKSLEEMEFVVKDSKKEKIGLPAFSEWTGDIYAEGKKSILTQVTTPQLRVHIKRQGGKVEVRCEAVQPKQLVDYGKSKENVRKFFERLNQNLLGS